MEDWVFWTKEAYSQEGALPCLLNGKPSSREELQSSLKFYYLPQITFEDPEVLEEVKEKGFRKLALPEGGVTSKELEFGQKYIDKIKAGFIPKVAIEFLGDPVGYGLFAEEVIYSGSYVGEYTGIVRKNQRQYFAPFNNYCYEYPVPDEIGRSFVIDATNGNLTRFINHSFEPNLKPMHVFYEGFYHLIFIAMRDINVGDQLLFNYGKSYWVIRGMPARL